MRGARTADVGRLGEALAALASTSLDLRVLGRRVLTACGEIDLVLTSSATVVACEVKSTLAEPPTSVASRFRPGRRLSAHQLARQRRAVRSLDLGPTRVDLVEVWIGPRTGRVRIEHHADVDFRRTSSSHSPRLVNSCWGTIQSEDRGRPEHPHTA